MAEEEPTPVSKHGRNLPVAIATGLGLAALLLVTLFASGFAFLLLVTAVLLIAQHELYSVMRSKGFRPAAELGLGAALVIFGGAYARGAEAISFGLALAVIAAFLWYLVDPVHEGAAANIGATLLGIVYIPMAAAHVILMRELTEGPWLVVFAIGATVFYDVGAYATGLKLGRRKIAPHVSPGKTVEGALGATLFVFASALVLGPLLTPLNLWQSAAVAAVVALAAPAGDLAESLIKRDLKVKDMGTILPGHGGALDRVDALLFVIPAVYWLYRLVL